MTVSLKLCLAEGLGLYRLKGITILQEYHYPRNCSKRYLSLKKVTLCHLKSPISPKNIMYQVSLYLVMSFYSLQNISKEEKIDGQTDGT